MSSYRPGHGGDYYRLRLSCNPRNQPACFGDGFVMNLTCLEELERLRDQVARMLDLKMSPEARRNVLLILVKLEAEVRAQLMDSRPFIQGSAAGFAGGPAGLRRQNRSETIR
jgi:hypothetical protein